MERFAVRKNVLSGFLVLYPVIALVLLITEKESPRDMKRVYITSLVFAALEIACSIIPFLGWLAMIVLAVFYVMTIVQFFKGNLAYEVPLVGLIINNFDKDKQPVA